MLVNCSDYTEMHGQQNVKTYRNGIYVASVVAIFMFNPMAQELFFLILAHPVYKMWIIQEPNKLALWNKLHFEQKETESIEHV